MRMHESVHGGMGQIDRLPAEAFAKLDESSDAAFYAAPRFVTHIDDRAIAAVTDLYRSLFRPGDRLLDLMSSWVSHLPEEVAFREVVGHGLNLAELAANPRLTRSFVQDLNADATLPLATGGFDGAMLCVGIQYLQRPVAVLGEVRRVLEPGGTVAITFSNRCFPTKAVAIWTSLSPEGQTKLISLYLEEAGFRTVTSATLREGLDGDPLSAVIGSA